MRDTLLTYQKGIFMKNNVFIVLFLVSLSMLLSSCLQGNSSPPQVEVTLEEPTSNPDFSILGVVEVSFANLGSDDFDVTAISLEPEEAGLDSQTLDRSEVKTGVQFRYLDKSFFDQDGYRYYSATYEVRNAARNGTAYTTARENLTFLALGVGYADTIAFLMRRADGTDYSDDTSLRDTIALSITPTHGMTYSVADGLEISEDNADFQAFTESEISGILNKDILLPYGFVVRHKTNTDSRALAANPAVDDYDGTVTFAGKYPLQRDSNDDAATIKSRFVLVDDDVTRVTESVEEQSDSTAETRADEFIPPAEVFIDVAILGNSLSSFTDNTTTRICSLRTAGTSASPTAYLVNETTGVCDSFSGGQIYVDDTATGNDDGSSWTNAYNYLQDALSAWEAIGSPSSVPIWVAEGMYYPDDGIGQTEGNVDSSFFLQRNLDIYGGFPDDGSADEISDAAPDTNLTILSGDLDHNDTTDTNGIVTEAIFDGVDSFSNPLGSNAYHVVRARRANNSMLNGFVITAGVARGSDFAGGMLIRRSTIDLTNLWFSGNAAELDTGALDMLFSTVSFDNVDFSGNATYGPGGAVYVTDSDLTIDNSDFSNNAGEAGGAIFIIGDSGIDINNSSFSNNEASEDGGAILATSDCCAPTLNIINTIFNNNFADTDGGALLLYDTDTTIVNSVFSQNESDDDGGALYITGISDVDITNSSFSNNNALDYGGGIRVGSTVTLDLINSILWGNTADVGEAQQIADNNNTANSLTISYSIIEGGEAGILDVDEVASTGVSYDTSNLESDPVFTDASNDDLTLTGCSPAIDSGNSDAITETTDLAGNDRFVDDSGVVDTGNNTTQDSTVDMGAYEYQGTSSGCI